MNRTEFMKINTEMRRVYNVLEREGIAFTNYPEVADFFKTFDYPVEREGDPIDGCFFIGEPFRRYAKVEWLDVGEGSTFYTTVKFDADEIVNMVNLVHTQAEEAKECYTLLSIKTILCIEE